MSIGSDRRSIWVVRVSLPTLNMATVVRSSHTLSPLHSMNCIHPISCGFHPLVLYLHGVQGGVIAMTLYSKRALSILCLLFSVLSKCKTTNTESCSDCGTALESTPNYGTIFSVGPPILAPFRCLPPITSPFQHLPPITALGLTTVVRCRREDVIVEQGRSCHQALFSAQCYCLN